MKRIYPILLCVVAFFAVALYPGEEYRVTGSGASVASGVSATPALSATPAATPSPSPTPAPTVRPTPEPSPIIKGATSSDVTTVQEKLAQWGFTEETPDGVYGNNTVEAVKRLQEYMNVALAANGLDWGDVADGVTALSADTDAIAVEGDDGASLLDYPVSGEVYAKMMPYIFGEESLPVYRQTVQLGDENDQVLRVQYRLNNLGYIYKGTDGAFGEKTEKGLRAFQETNGLNSTGIADQTTQEVLFSSYALKSTKPVHEYKIIVDVSDQRVYVYMWNDGEYNTLIQKFKCSTGVKSSPTPLGTYSDTTGPGERWHYFKDFNCWAQYAFTIQGNILFHSVLYDKQDTSTLRGGSLYSLGHRASHGCVRLKVDDAKWIWQNCEAGTTVIIQK